MIRMLTFLLFSFLLAAADAPKPAERAPLPRHVLTNDGLLVLARAGLSDSLLCDLVRQKQTHFDTSADALAELARLGLSESVIRIVVEKQDQVQFRPPKLVVTPPAGGPPMEVQPGDVLMLAPPGAPAKGKRTEPQDRWYRLSVQQ